MSAFSPGERIEPTKSSIVQLQRFDDEELLKKLQNLKEIAYSCYGPYGSIKIIHNNCGGHNTITASSGRLFNTLSVSKPYLKLIIDAVSNHVNRYSDGGLYALILCISLVENGIGTNLNPNLVSDIFAYLGQEAISCIKNQLTMKGDVLSLNAMLGLVKNVVGAKRGAFIVRENVEFISKLILEAFLTTIPTNCDSSLKKILTLTVNGLDVKDSHLKKGILLPYIYTVLTKNSIKNPKICAVTASMSGDSDEFASGNYEFIDMECTSVDIVVDQWIKLCEKIISDGVNIVICQKVIHPAIRQFLHEHQIQIIDRVGAVNMNAVTDMIGCTSVTSLTCSLTSGHYYGKLDSIDLVNINKKTYYHLYNIDTPVRTLVLCNWSEESVEELKYICNSAEHILQMSVFHPEVLPGAGCLETQLIHILNNKIFPESGKLGDKFGCSKSQLQTITTCFIRSITSVIKRLSVDCEISEHWVDDSYNHHWLDVKDTCLCGKLTNNVTYGYKNLAEINRISLPTGNDSAKNISDLSCKCNDTEILDLAVVKIHSINVAVTTAATVLRIGCYIHDVN